MIVNICCSSSSGSTLLARILNNHPDVVCGQEIGLFSKPIVYEGFDRLRRHHGMISRLGVSSAPFHLERSFLRNMESYGLSDDMVKSWIGESRNISDFATTFKDYLSGKTGKTIWAEKTPNNIFSIARFCKWFPDAKIIHLVRDPRDAILSLIKRGHSKQTAAMAWLSSVASIQSIRKNPNLYELRYEDLVMEPEKKLEELCQHLAIDYDFEYFISDKNTTRSITLFAGHKTWGNAPADLFSTSSIGRYQKDPAFFDDILPVRISAELAEVIHSGNVTILDLMGEYGYAIPAAQGGPHRYHSHKTAIDYPGGKRKYLVYLITRRFLQEQKIIPLAEF